ncbi:MAG: peptide chain release factor N(5)-glutamine methyltransferase [Candidatus Omnitrophota bacterium]
MTEAELLFTQILGCNRLSLYLNESMPLARGKSQAVSLVLKRRIFGEPLQYILGKTEFMGLEFKVNKDVLIPRQETEILVETAINIVKLLNCSTVKLLDLGTGSGCIAVSLAKFLQGVGITANDISKSALKTARENAVLNNVADRIEFVEGDLFDYGQGQALSLPVYDLIVTNPPYIVTEEIDNLQREVQYEPRIALDGGADGLCFYRRIIKEAPAYLKENGFLIMEMGFNQCDAIKNIFRKSGKFEIIEIVKDYSGIERVIVGKKHNKVYS